MKLPPASAKRRTMAAASSAEAPLFTAAISEHHRPEAQLGDPQAGTAEQSGSASQANAFASLTAFEASAVKLQVQAGLKSKPAPPRSENRRARVRPGAELGCPVAGMASRQRSSDRQPQRDAFGEPELEPLELGDPLVDARCPLCSTDATSRGGSASRSGGSLASSAPISSSVNPNVLGEDDERDPAQHLAGIAAMTRAGPLGADQAALP